MISHLVRTLLVALICGCAVAQTTAPDIKQGDTQPTDSVVVNDSLGTKRVCVAIARDHDQLPGHHATVRIIKESGNEPISGFNLLIDYDSLRMQFLSGTLGDCLADSTRSWKTFRCSREDVDSVLEQRPSGLLRIVAAADTAGRDTSASRYIIPDGATLATLKFSTVGREDCITIPIRFVWRDCPDNSLSSADGGSILTADSVLDWRWLGWDWNGNNDLTGRGAGFRYSYGGIPRQCVSSAGFDSARRTVTFRNGGVDFICIEGIEAKGDINLNGIADEIGDGVLFADYLLKGLPAMSDSVRKTLDRMADVNADGRSLGIADLVYLQRIIVGDVLPYAKLKPFGDTVAIALRDSVLSAATPARIAGVYAVFGSDHNYSVESLCRLPLESCYDSVAQTLTVLQACVLGRIGGDTCARIALDTGETQLFIVYGPVTLKSVQVSDYDGNLLASHNEDKYLPPYFGFACTPVSRPESDSIYLDLYLPGKTDWQIDLMDSRRQLLHTFSGNDYGHKSVKWDWSEYLPGDYSFTVNAASYTETRIVTKWK